MHSTGCEVAFREAMRIMKALHARFATSGAEPTREAFYTVRNAMAATGSSQRMEASTVACAINLRACRLWRVGMGEWVVMLGG